MPAKSDLLHGNLYRILGISVCASEREIIGRIDELKTWARIGRAPSYPRDALLPGPISRDLATIAACEELLRIPEKKIEHALSWFWECTVADTKAVDALAQGGFDEAEKIWWRGGCRVPDIGALSAVKNSAQMYTVQLCNPGLNYDQACHYFANAKANWEMLFRSPSLLTKLASITGISSFGLTPQDIRNIVEPGLSALLKVRRGMLETRAAAKALFMAKVDAREKLAASTSLIGKDVHTHAPEPVTQILQALPQMVKNALKIKWTREQKFFAVTVTTFLALAFYNPPVSVDTHNPVDDSRNSAKDTVPIVDSAAVSRHVVPEQRSVPEVTPRRLLTGTSSGDFSTSPDPVMDEEMEDRTGEDDPYAWMETDEDQDDNQEDPPEDDPDPEQSEQGDIE